MPRSDSVYQHVLKITTDYLGPASQRFVDRQIQSHIGKEPVNLTRQDITKFITWSRIALAVLTDDSELIEEYTRRLQNLKVQHKASR